MRNANRTRMNWHLYELMGKRMIRTATDLHRMLAEIGVTISSSQLSRLINRAPQRISDDLMFGLTLVLDCSPADLWSNPERGAGPASGAPPATKQQPRRKKTPPGSKWPVTGPPGGVYPIKSEEK